MLCTVEVCAWLQRTLKKAWLQRTPRKTRREILISWKKSTLAVCVWPVSSLRCDASKISENGEIFFDKYNLPHFLILSESSKNKRGWFKILSAIRLPLSFHKFYSLLSSRSISKIVWILIEHIGLHPSELSQEEGNLKYQAPLMSSPSPFKVRTSYRPVNFLCAKGQEKNCSGLVLSPYRCPKQIRWMSAAWESRGDPRIRATPWR